MNVFGNRVLGNTVNAAWSDNITIGKKLFDFYNSLGDVTISSSTQIPSKLDGPIVVRRYDNLTVSAPLTTQYRCRGLRLLVDGNLTVTSGGQISMAGRGARGNASLGLYDVLIPDSIKLESVRISKRDVLDKIRSQGWCLCDRWLWDEWGKIDGVAATAWTGGTVLLTAGGCGVGADGRFSASVVNISGSTGGVGTLFPGGGSGGLYSGPGASGFGAPGRPWGGGPGGGAASNTFGPATYPTNPVDMHGGKGGIQVNGVGDGAGNPAGDNSASGTGGCLYIICKGNVLINAGGLIDADGVPAPANSTAPGGSSGGGFVAIVYGGTYTNNGTVRANGGVARQGTIYGGAGGAGAVITKTFGQMGWT